MSEVIHYVKKDNGKVLLSLFNCKNHVCVSHDKQGNQIMEGILFDIPKEFAEEIAMTIQYENDIEGMAKQHGGNQ